MADTGETSTAAATAEVTYEHGGRGGGGKLRRERKPPATPYDRPSSHRSLISRFVDPAKRLFSGFPSIFSSSSNLVDEVHTAAQEEDGYAEENCSLDPVVTESTGVFVPREDKGKSKLVISDEDGLHKREDEDGCDKRWEEDGPNKRQVGSSGALPDIEQLIKAKTFSREDVDRLMKILHSKVVDVEQDRIDPSMKGIDGVERAETSNRRLKSSSSLDEEEELNKFKFATSTPLHRPTVQDEIGATPFDIAKAYTSSRTSEMGFTSTRPVQKSGKLGLTSENLASSVMPSHLRKAPICWPGVITQNQQDYSTPLNRNNRSGLNRFSRTPYSRTVYTKSKSKLDPLRSDNERFPSILPAPFQPTASPFYEKLKSNVAENNYGTGGPIRRTRDKFALATPTRDSPLFTTARKSPFAARQSTTDVFPKNSFELGSTSKINIEPVNSKGLSPEARVRSVHPHSDRLARRILEQLDRPVTPKEHSKELSLAVSKQDASVENDTSSSLIGVGGDISKDADGVEHYGLTNKERHALPQGTCNAIIGAENVDLGSKSVDKTSSNFGVDNGPSPSFDQFNTQRISEQGNNNNLSRTSVLFGDPSKGAATTSNNSPRSDSQNSQRKPILPSIAIEKSGISASFSSIASPGFTFPVTTSSITSTEPPTPSVIPSFLAGPSQPKGSANLPTFNFGNKITIAPPVVAFSSKATTTPIDGSVPTFKFGSGKPRLAFAVLGDDDTSTPSDAAIPKYKFGSGESRLNFGTIESDAMYC